MIAIVDEVDCSSRIAQDTMGFPPDLHERIRLNMFEHGVRDVIINGTAPKASRSCIGWGAILDIEEVK